MDVRLENRLIELKVCRDILAKKESELDILSQEIKEARKSILVVEDEIRSAKKHFSRRNWNETQINKLLVVSQEMIDDYCELFDNMDGLVKGIYLDE